MQRACHKPRDQGTKGRQGEEGVGGMPRVLLNEVFAGGVKGGRGQADIGPGTQGPGKGGKFFIILRFSLRLSTTGRSLEEKHNSKDGRAWVQTPWRGYLRSKISFFVYNTIFVYILRVPVSMKGSKGHQKSRRQRKQTGFKELAHICVLCSAIASPSLLSSSPIRVNQRRGRRSTQGAGLGQGAGAEGGSREGGLPRELLRIVLALAGGRR